MPPTASRPHMPGYGILDAGSGSGLLPWEWAAQRLTEAHNYWLATKPNGRPHTMAVWGVWLNSAFHFSTGTSSRKGRNILANPHCVVSTEHADEAVIVEGVAEATTDRELLSRFVREYKAKYNWEMDPGAGGIYSVRPTVVFGFIEHADQFAGSATRWTFADQ